MTLIIFKYFILDCDEVIFESTAQVKLSQKDLNEIEKFIRDHNFSPEFVDIPGKIYDKCMEKAYEKASSEYPDINERYDELEIVLEQNIPISLIELLSEDIKKNLLANDPYDFNMTEVIKPTKKIDGDANKSLDELEGNKTTIKIDDINHTDTSARITQQELGIDDKQDGEEDYGLDDDNQDPIVPSKENTLYLPIKQVYFDEIIAGSKKKEYREVKPTTYKKYLKCDPKGNPFVDTSLIDMDDPLCDDINVWNNGVYPLLPNDAHKFLHLAVGYNKERDEAVVEISDISFEPLVDENGKAFRFDEENGKAFRCENGRLCFWNIVYHLGRVWDIKKNAGRSLMEKQQPKKPNLHNSNLKTLTLQINKENFDTILNGTQRVEHRFIYPSNESRYVRYFCEGKEYKKLYDTPENDSPIETIPIKYDALYLINGRKKDAPRLTIEVLDAEVVRIVDENGNEITYEDNGLTYSQCQIWYHLGKIISTENIND